MGKTRSHSVTALQMTASCEITKNSPLTRYAPTEGIVFPAVFLVSRDPYLSKVNNFFGILPLGITRIWYNAV